MSLPIWHLKGKPYAAQAEALKQGAGRPGYLYALEMGLGKTGIALNEMTDLSMKEEIAGGITIAPNSILQNWVDEAEIMGFKGNTYIWPDIKKIEYDRLFNIMVNYEAIITPRGREFLDSVIKRYSGKIYLTAEESSKIKNHKAQRTKEAIYQAMRCKYTRCLSGLPAPENVGNLWSQLTFIKALNGMRFYPFRNIFCEMGGYMGREIVGPKNVDRLQGILDTCAFFAALDDWTDIPERIYTKRISGMSPEQKKAYDTMQEEFYAEVRGQEITVNMAVTQLQKLQQIVSGWINDETGRPVRFFDDPRKIPKMQSLMEGMEEVRGKAVVFCFHKESILDCVKALKHWNPVWIMGKQNEEAMDQDAAKNKFNSDPKCRVTVNQIQTGGIGLTLLGQKGKDRCTTMFFYENVFGLEPRKQAEARNRRHGQDEKQVVVDFVSTPIEARAIHALQKKQDLSNVVRDPLLWKPRGR